MKKLLLLLLLVPMVSCTNDDEPSNAIQVSDISIELSTK